MMNSGLSVAGFTTHSGKLTVNSPSAPGPRNRIEDSSRTSNKRQRWPPRKSPTLNIASVC